MDQDDALLLVDPAAACVRQKHNVDIFTFS